MCFGLGFLGTKNERLYVYHHYIHYLYDSDITDRNLYWNIMTTKESFEIVLKLAKANTLAEHDIMYLEQLKQYNREQEALAIAEDYYNDLIRR